MKRGTWINRLVVVLASSALCACVVSDGERPQDPSTNNTSTQNNVNNVNNTGSDVGPTDDDDGGNETDDDTGSQTSALTYYEDVKPIVDAKCTPCHYEGGIAPFPLLTFEQVHGARELIKPAVRDQIMPPFLADSECRDYLHDPSLSDEQIGTLVEWIDSGAAEGDPADEGEPLEVERPEPPTFDTNLQNPEPYTPRQSPDDYRCFVLDWPHDEDRFITGFGVEPGQASIVHHIIAFKAGPGAVAQAEQNDADEEGPGYTCFGGPGLGESVEDIGWLGSWAPGGFAARYPEGTGVPVEAGSKIVMQVHYNTLGRDPLEDQTTVNFETSETVDKQAMFLPWANPQWLNGGMTIPAGESDATHSFGFDPTSDFILGDTVTIHSAGLHMHLLGKSSRTWVRRAGGGEDCIVDIPRWDFDWQGGVALAEPVVINRGDTLNIECRWDNTAENQPIVNGERVTPEDRSWGEGTLDEMCLGVYYVTVGE